MIKVDQKMAWKCYKSSLTKRRGTYVVTIQEGESRWIVEADISDERQRGPTGEVWEREINGKKFKLGTSLCKESEDKIADVISENMNAFTWSSANMPGIDPGFLCHRLTMDEKIKPVVQRRRKFNEEKCLVIQEETHKLFVVGHIREIQYPEWLANVVLVKKTNGKWKMCVDFTELNKACPKDSYPLPSINSLIDNALGWRLLCFLDAFSRYNQIRIHPRDKSKTTFMVEVASYCYNIMPLAWKTLRWPIKGSWTGSFHLSSDATFKHMWMTWSSRRKGKVSMLPT